MIFLKDLIKQSHRLASIFIILLMKNLFVAVNINMHCMPVILLLQKNLHQKYHDLYIKLSTLLLAVFENFRKNVLSFAYNQLTQYFHHIGLLFGPFHNNPSHTEVQRKQKCYHIDPNHFLFPFGAMQ